MVPRKNVAHDWIPVFKQILLHHFALIYNFYNVLPSELTTGWGVMHLFILAGASMLPSPIN